MDKQMTVTVGENAKRQGSGFAVETYTAEGIRTTESRWTTRERAIREARELAAKINAKVCIY